MAICPVCSKSFATKADLRAHVMAKHPGQAKHYYSGTQSRAAGGKSSSSAKAMGTGVGGWISMEEYLGTCPGDKTTLLSICPGKTGMARLDSYAVLFDQYCIEKWDVRFTSRVGNTVPGMYVAGAVYSHADSPNGLSEVAALQPKVHHPVWEGSHLSISPARLMKQKWMYVYNRLLSKEDSIAGKVAVHVAGATAVVDVWVSYSVKFSGPTNSNSKTELKLVHDGRDWTLNGKPVTKLPEGFDEGYTVDVESNKDVAGSLEKFFDAFKVLDSIVQTSVYYYHVIAGSFIAGAVLPVLGFPVIMHVVRTPFPAILPTVSGSLSGGRKAEEEDPQAASGAEGSEYSFISRAGSVGEPSERL